MNLMNVLREQALKAGKQTISTTSPDGDVLIFMSKNELDPMAALMLAGVTIVRQRETLGLDVSHETVRVEANRLITSPEHAYTWEVYDKTTSQKLASGFASSQNDADRKAAHFIATGELL